ncbi:hypothetical protein [Streptomyces ochraceiscleroticus]|uniref:Uncharacterized protein n=1 Tax=Streptomyces ochraceiscleroticus TaxID=47761 RepID=A0ABW1MBY6_9ACTN|nr:hypothetical protein [Streptomyces ochraceiscleroticus]
MGATGRAHRSAAWTLLLLLTVVFAPLLCGTSGGPAATRAAAASVTMPATASVAAPGSAPSEAAPVSDVAPAPVAASAPKKCAPHDAPGQGETVPAPATHRGEPLAAPAVTPVPYLSHDPASCALARPPTGPAPATDPCALLPVLRI